MVLDLTAFVLLVVERDLNSCLLDSRCQALNNCYSHPIVGLLLVIPDSATVGGLTPVRGQQSQQEASVPRKPNMARLGPLRPDLQAGLASACSSGLGALSSKRPPVSAPEDPGRASIQVSLLTESCQASYCKRTCEISVYSFHNS